MIENEFYEDEFEQLLKEKADQFSMYPSKRVWHSIYNNLHPGRRWPSVVISLVLISSLMLIGYLNTGENSITRQINIAATDDSLNQQKEETDTKQNTHNKSKVVPVVTSKIPVTAYSNAFEDVITNETDFYTYTIVKSNRPTDIYTQATPADDKKVAEINLPADNNAATNDVAVGGGIVQSLDGYIKAGKIFSDIAVSNKKYNNSVLPSTDENMVSEIAFNTVDTNPPSSNNGSNTNEMLENAKVDLEKLSNSKKATTETDNTAGKKTITKEEKAWLENYALQNKSSSKKWKGRLAYDIYITPAVNYRKLTTKTHLSATPFAEGDVNKSISQKPGVGMEAGFALSYAVAKNLRFKSGVQFNYTSYNIAADQTNHPVSTDILLNDPTSGLSYSSARTTTISNVNNGTALTPITLHNRTYQISIPLGLAYKLSSKNNVDWFAGATVQPSYVFGGNAHIISSDLKSYVSEPSSIRSWNLNVGFETYMNFKLGTYGLQVGPQVRYQVNSTYKSSVALVEKPYALGLKFGLTKGF